MSVDPFIEAEEVAGRSVNNACRLLEVSRAVYYQRRKAVPSARDISDAELTDKITAIHAESRRTYGSPRVFKELRNQGVTCGKRRVRRLMRLAGLEGRCKKRWRKTTVADPEAEKALDLIQRAFGPGAEIALLTSGGVDCWGWGYHGQLGNGTFLSSATPVAVEGVGGTGALTRAASLASAYEDSCAVITSGGVDCWGWGYEGELGNGSSSESATPVAVEGVGGTGALTRVVSLASSYMDYCAVLSSSEVDCWGSGGNGQLGNGTFSDSATPVQVQ